MKTEEIYFDFIFDAISKIELYIKDFTKEQFLKDSKTQSAVIMQLTLIGEYSKKITPETKEKIDLLWREIMGFRDIAIHEYMRLELEAVWDTVQRGIPEMKAKLLAFTDLK